MPIDPCGRIVDCLSTFYIADCQFGNDPNVTAKIKWYRCARTAKPLGFVCSFGSAVWKENQPCEGAGERPHFYKDWWNGNLGVIVPGNGGICGPRDWFSGAPLANPPGLVRYSNGLAKCCGIVPDAQFQFLPTTSAAARSAISAATASPPLPLRITYFPPPRSIRGISSVSYSVPFRSVAPLTFAAWVRVNQLASPDMYIGDTSGGGNWHFVYSPLVAPGSIAFSDFGATVASNGLIADNLWHLVGIDWDGAIVRFWIDGALDSAFAWVSPFVPDVAPLSILSSAGPVATKQSITRIWDRLLSLGEWSSLAALADVDAGLVNEWLFDDPQTGVLIQDYIGGNNGTLSASAFWDSDHP